MNMFDRETMTRPIRNLHVQAGRRVTIVPIQQVAIVQGVPKNPAPEIYRQVVHELQESALKAAMSLREVSVDMGDLKRALKSAGRRDDFKQWERLCIEFRRVNSNVMKYAFQSQGKVQDLQDTLFLLSSADVRNSREEIHASLNEGLKSFCKRARDAAEGDFKICRGITNLAKEYLGRKDFPKEIRIKLRDIESKIRGLIEREVPVGSEEAIFDQRIVGIVKALASFVQPSTYLKLLSFIGREDMPNITSELPDSKGVKMKVNILEALMNIGNLLVEDVEEVQGQYTNCETQVELDNCKANFKNVLKLYESYAGVLGLFGEACILTPEPKWTFLDWCQNRKTAKQFSDGLPSIPRKAEGDDDDRSTEDLRGPMLVRIFRAFFPFA